MDKQATPLQAYRAARGFTVKEFAVFAGISTASVSRIERGEQWPSKVTLSKLMKATGLSAEELAGLSGGAQ